MRLPQWILKRLPCKECQPIRDREPLQIKWPIQVFLTEEGANFRCHRCGRTGLIDRSAIPRM